MRRLRDSMRWGSLEAAALLAIVGVGGCGNVANLGEGQGGQGGDSAGRGGGAGIENGPRGGGPGVITPIYGGSGGLNTNGGAGGSPPALDYPHDASVPLDPDCSCPDPSSVCNAHGTCMPRCDRDGVCALWRVDRAVTGMLTDGEDLFLLLSPERDALGNLTPGAKSVLLRARDLEQPPSEVASFAGLRTGGRLIGRVSDKTYVVDELPPAHFVLAISDDGSVAKRDFPSLAGWVDVGASGLYWQDSGGLQRLPLDLSGDPELLHEPSATGSSQGLLVSDKIWFGRDEQMCAFDPELPDAVSCLTPVGPPFAARGNDIFTLVQGLIGEVHRQSLDEQDRILYRPREGGRYGLAGGPTLFADSLYGFARKSENTMEFIQFPALVAREPQAAVSDSIVGSLSAAQENTKGTSIPLYCVGSAGVFMTQRFQDLSGEDANVSRYVFRAPLPNE